MSCHIKSSSETVSGTYRNDSFFPAVHTVRGIVKFYDSKRGFGFITRLDNKEDIFVHKSSIVKMNPKKFFQSLGLGEIVDFNIGVGKKDIEAINVTGPNGIPVQGAPKVP